MLINEETLLPVLLPLAPAATLLSMAAPEIGRWSRAWAGCGTPRPFYKEKVQNPGKKVVLPEINFI